MILKVEAHPNSKREVVEKVAEGFYKVYVKEKPVEGKANKAIVEALSDFFKIPKSKILLKKGEKGKIKIFEIIDWNRRKIWKQREN